MDTEWMSRSRCKDMDPGLFFPSDGMGVLAAQRICAQCAVALPCLKYALANRIGEGVWGGASERQRQRLLRQGLPSDLGTETKDHEPPDRSRPSAPLGALAAAGHR